MPGDTIQISDADNQLVAMMTLNEMWDDYDDPNDVEESVVYVYDGLTRWGYVDTDHNAQHDSGTETLLDSVAVLDTNGDYVSITNYENDGATISSVTTFDWPLEGYQVTRILDAAGDTIQISDADNQLVAMMTLNEMWDDYDDPNDVEESVVYVYDGLTRWGYVDTDHNAQHDSGTETLLDSVAVLDTNGDYVSITNYENDGATISSVTTFDWPLEGYQVTRILDAAGDTIQISDADNQLVAMMTLNEMWDDYDDPNDVEESVVYVYDGLTRWGYVDTDHNAQHDSGTETLLDSVAVLDTNGDYVSITNYENDGATISSVTTFDWPLEGYQVTRILDAAGDTIQISDADNQLVAMMTLNEMWDDYDDPNDVEESVVYVYDGLTRWGYVDTDHNAQHDSGTETLLDSVAVLDTNGDYVSITNYENDGATISSVTTFDWPLEGYQVTRILDAAGDTIQISDADNQLVAMMTLNEMWDDYDDPNDVEESVVYVYDGLTRWGYVDTDHNAQHDSGTETLLDSVAVLDTNGDYVSITNYENDGATISSVTTFDWPLEGYQVTRILDAAGDTIQISDADNQLVAMMTLNEMWDDYDDPNDVEESVVYVYDGLTRWGYVDTDHNAQHDSGTETLLDSVAVLDTNGDYVSITNYENDGATISSVTTFDWPLEGYQVTRILDAAGDTIQISDADNQLVAMMTLNEMWDDYDDPNDVEESVVYVYDGLTRWGYVDTDHNAQHDSGTETLLDSVAVLDTNGDYVSITNYENDGATISSVTTFDWPLEGYQVTRILDAAGDTIQISDADNQLVAMMTLNEMWDDYDDPNDVEESVVYVYDGLTRWGYVDTDHNAQHDSGTETLLDSVAVLDTNGDYVSITNYENDGATISSVTTFDWPLEGYQVTRILDAGGDTIQISDADNQLVAMMTLNEMWDDYDDPNDVEESVVYVYDGLTRWGYVDTDHNAQHDSGTETLLDSVAVLDTNGDYVSITNYENDGATISSVTTFDWPLEGYQVTRILDAAGDTIQISDADNQLVAMMTLNEMWDDYDDPNDVEESVVYVYDGLTRWGYVDTDHNAQHDSGTETLLDSVAVLDTNGDYVSITNYENDGATISSVTTFDWPLEGYQVTRVLDAGGDTIQISDADNQLVAMMTLNEMWDDYDDPNDVEESVVYVYDGLTRWGYVDTDHNAQHDSGTETLLDSVAVLDTNGDYVSITNYENDGATISSVTTFDWPLEGYQVTRILDAAGDTIQISDADNQLVAMMTLNEMWDDYDDPNDVEESVVYVYDQSTRWGYVDTDHNAQHDSGTETLLDSVAVRWIRNGDYVSITNYEPTVATISSVTTFDWPLEGYQVTRIT